MGDPRIKVIADALEQSGDVGCGCCTEGTSRFDGLDECPYEEEYDWYDHSYEEGCLAGVPRTERLAMAALAALEGS